MRILNLILLPIFVLALSTYTRRPPVVLWAWERPENLTFIDPNKVGVAYLAKTITLRGDKTLVRPRLQPLAVPEGTKLIAVVRIETDRHDPPALSSIQLHETAREISALSVQSAVQIDFDATVSQRDFYRSLLTEVRKKLPASTSLSITALASWCAGDDWLNDLPIDEAVPMLFRLGVEERQFQRRLELARPFESRICQNAAGVSTDELVKPPPVERLYIFSPTNWSESSFNHAMEVYAR